MRSALFDNAELPSVPGAFALQNDRMLKVDLAGTSGHFFARQGAMVAYQGEVDFAYQGSGGVAKMFKKAFTGEGMALMKVTGSGQVFLAHQADEVALLELEGDSCTVNGDSVLAFTDGLSWDINRAEGATVLSGGLFNTTFTGRGMLAVTVFGTPVALRVDAPTFVDMQSAVLWTSGLTTSIRAGSSAARDRFRELLAEPAAAQALATVVDRARRQTVALLCFEADPARCHRQLIGEAVTQMLGDGSTSSVRASV